MAFGWNLGDGFARAPRGPRVTILRGWPALDELADEWVRLFDEQDHPAPCVSHAAFRALRRVAGDEIRPVFVTVESGGRLAAVLPLEERSVRAARVLRPLGFGHLARHEPLVGRVAESLDAGAILRIASIRLGARTLFDLRSLRATAPGSRWLAESVAGRGAWRRLAGELESTVSLRGGWPRVEVALSLTLRRLAARGRRRAERSGGIRVEGSRPRGSEDVASLLELAGRDRGCHVDTPLLEALAVETSVRGRLRLLEIRQRHALIAGSLVWVGGRQAVELLTCTEDRLAGLHLDALVRYELYRHLAQAEIVDALLHAPGARVDAGLPPDRQIRLIGAPASGFGQLVAGSVARLADDRVQPGRFIARWRQRRRARAEEKVIPPSGERAGTPVGPEPQFVEAESR